jgi:hypothetical protein
MKQLSEVIVTFIEPGLLVPNWNRLVVFYSMLASTLLKCSFRARILHIVLIHDIKGSDHIFVYRTECVRNSQQYHT